MKLKDFEKLEEWRGEVRKAMTIQRMKATDIADRTGYSIHTVYKVMSGAFYSASLCEAVSDSLGIEPPSHE